MRAIVKAPMPTVLSADVAKAQTYPELAAVTGLRTHLAQEQGYVCAYCETKLKLDTQYSTSKHLTKIEHFHPQAEGVPWDAECPSRSGASSAAASLTATTNVVLCCHGNATKTPKGLKLNRKMTCDSAKGSKHLCALFQNPKTTALPWLAKVLPNGKLEAHPSLPPGAQGVIDSVLNLNDPPLVVAREEAWRETHRRVLQWKAKHQGLSQARRANLRQKLISEAEESGMAFRSVRISYAETLV